MSRRRTQATSGSNRPPEEVYTHTSQAGDKVEIPDPAPSYSVQAPHRMHDPRQQCVINQRDKPTVARAACSQRERSEPDPGEATIQGGARVRYSLDGRARRCKVTVPYPVPPL
jgi:hypothetical protein